MAGVDRRRHATVVGAERWRIVLCGTNRGAHACWCRPRADMGGNRTNKAVRRAIRPTRVSYGPDIRRLRRWPALPDDQRQLGQRSECDSGQYGGRAQLGRRADASGAAAVKSGTQIGSRLGLHVRAARLGCRADNPAAFSAGPDPAVAPALCLRHVQLLGGRPTWIVPWKQVTLGGAAATQDTPATPGIV